MKAAHIHAFGDASVFRYEECAPPSVGANEVLLQLKAASLNHLDVWVRSGQRERNIPLPHIPGSDGAGIIAALGSEVKHLALGDRVLISPGISCGHCARCLAGDDNLCRDYGVLGVRANGTYAEYVALPAVNVAPIPDGLDFHGAAAIPLVFLTAWHMLVGLAKLRPGETVLVHGAGSGVGSAAIQIAKMLHARVLTTAGSDAKLARGRELGADEGINYAASSFTEEVKRLTGKRGVDVVFEHIGGKVLEESITVLAKGGRLVTCGATTEFTATIDVRYVYSRHQTIHGSWMGRKDELLAILPFFAGPSPRLRPVIDQVFPLAEAAAAHRRLEERKHFGKIVLAM